MPAASLAVLSWLTGKAWRAISSKGAGQASSLRLRSVALRPMGSVLRSSLHCVARGLDRVAAAHAPVGFGGPPVRRAASPTGESWRLSSRAAPAPLDSIRRLQPVCLAELTCEIILSSLWPSRGRARRRHGRFYPSGPHIFDKLGTDASRRLPPFSARCSHTLARFARQTWPETSGQRWPSSGPSWAKPTKFGSIWAYAEMGRT